MSQKNSIFNWGRCDRCSMHECAKCNALVEDGYMVNAETGEIIDNAVTVYDTFGEVTMCESSAWLVASICEDDDSYHTDYVRTVDTFSTYSLRYAADNFYQCDDCGGWFEYDDSLFYTHGGRYCEECKTAHSIIESYHAHSYEYTPIGGTWSDDLIGLEIESDGYGYSGGEDCALDLDYHFNRYGDVLVFEDDCSLHDGGFETITQPHTLDALRDFDFDALADIMLRNGAYENACTAGLHMHFSRSWFGADCEEQEQTAARLIVNYHNNFDTLASLSCREDWYSIDEYAADTTPSGETFAEIFNDAYYAGRYQAVNVTPSKTIEFRLGAAYLDADYIRAWIELHVAMVNACRRGYDFIVNDDYTITLCGAQAANFAA